MGEEGPEPQELLEQAEESHHHAEHAEHEQDEQRKRFTTQSAITASVLAVGAALASLLSGHAANEAILKTVEASDQWSYYQANSTKAHLFESNRSLIAALGNADQVKQTDAEFQQKLAKYNSDKETIRQKAEELEKQARLEFDRHQKCSYGVAAFQIGIVLSSMAILIRSKVLYGGSLGAGIIGLICTIVGLLAG